MHFVARTLSTNCFVKTYQLINIKPLSWQFSQKELKHYSESGFSEFSCNFQTRMLIVAAVNEFKLITKTCIFYSTIALSFHLAFTFLYGEYNYKNNPYPAFLRYFNDISTLK